MDETKNELNDRVRQFKKKHGIHHVIAFSGGADTELPGVPADDPLQKQYGQFVSSHEEQIVGQALDILRHYRIAVLSGGTKYGVPKRAIEAAQERGIKTIGVFPKTALESGKVVEGIDLPISVEPRYGQSRWGDEASVFAKLLDAAIVIAGKAGTLVEIAHILKINEVLKKTGVGLKLIIPMHGTGGVADGLPFIWGKQEIKNACIPPKPIETGAQAARYIDESFDLWNL